MATVASPVPTTPEGRVVEAQLVAYNAHDIEAFAATFHEEVRIYKPQESDFAVMKGREAMCAYYSKNRFSIPGLRAEVLKRIECGSKVFDHEMIYGLGDEPFEMTACYEVREGKIINVWAFPAK